MTKQFHGNTLSHEALEQLFFEARSYNGWLDKDVSEDQIRRIYDLLKMGPTSANQQSARFVWCRSDEAKEKLASHAMEANKKKIKTAPWCVIIGYDIDFHEELPWLFPHTDAKSWCSPRARLGSIAGRCRASISTRLPRPSSPTNRSIAPTGSARSVTATRKRSSIAARVPISTNSTGSPKTRFALLALSHCNVETRMQFAKAPKGATDYISPNTRDRLRNGGLFGRAVRGRAAAFGCTRSARARPRRTAGADDRRPA